MQTRGEEGLHSPEALPDLGQCGEGGRKGYSCSVSHSKILFSHEGNIVLRSESVRKEGER